MADKTKLKGNGHINVNNVNGINSECITLTYTIWNFKDIKQVTSIQNGLYELIDQDVVFDLETKNRGGDSESHKLKVKIKSCHKEKQAHNIKTTIDEYVRKKGGQTTLDESIGNGDCPISFF